jgi:nicotinate-nucleotide pyrophosphorylase
VELEVDSLSQLAEALPLAPDVIMLDNLSLGDMREAVANDRVTVYNAIKDAGHPDLAELIRRL